MVAVILLIGLFFSACSYQGSEALFDLGGGPPVVNSCSGEQDCGDGETCYNGICVTRTMQPLEVTLEIAPAYNEVSLSNQALEDGPARNRELGEIEPAVTVVPSFFVSGLERRRRFEVPLLVEVSGTIRYNNDRVPAKITFVPIVRPFDINATRTITAMTTDQPILDSNGESSDFVTHVLQHVYYNVVVQPSEDSDYANQLPPFIKPDFIANGSTGKRCNVDYMGFNFLEGSFSLSLPANQNDLSFDVFAVSSDNPDLLVSSWKTFGDGIFGAGTPLEFNLAFYPNIDFFDLIVSPFIDRSDQESGEDDNAAERPIWPVFTIGGFDLANNAQSQSVFASESDQAGDHAVEIELPAVQQPVTFSGFVDLCETPDSSESSTDSSELSNETSNTDIPISFYSIALLGDDGQAAIKSSYSTRTNTRRDVESGGLSFTVDLLPGRYEVVVSPPLDSHCDVYAQEKTIVSEAQSGSRFQLAAKPYLKGTLKTVKGEPVFGATIYAQALNRDHIDQTDNPMITRFNRSNQTTTDENGRYELPLDLGSYDIIAKPPVASHYGWKVITDVAIDNRGGSFEHDLVLDAPVPIEGVLGYADSRSYSTTLSGLEGAEVRVFAIIDDKGDGENGKRNVAIGRVTADQKGDFTALISPSL